MTGKARSGGRRGPALIIIFVLLLVLVGVPAGVYVVLSHSRGAQVEVPSLVGLSPPEAGQALARVGLGLGKVEKVGSLDRQAGRIVGQQFKPGVKVKRGSSVKILVSKGPYVFVPDVAGLAAGEAAKTLAEARLVASGTETAASSDVEPGFVVATRPEGGSEAMAGSQVTLVVAAGSLVPPPFERPTARLAKIDIDDVGEDSFTLVGKVVITNPNPVEVLLASMHYSVDAEGVPLGRGRSNPKVTIAAGGKATVKVKLRVPFSKVPAVGPQVLERGQVKYRVLGHGVVSVQGRDMTVPLNLWSKYRFPRIQTMINYLRAKGKL